MERRVFIRNLCKAVGIAVVTPVALSSGFNEKYIAGCDPYALHGPRGQMIIMKGRRVGMSYVHMSMVLREYYCEPCSYGG